MPSLQFFGHDIFKSNVVSRGSLYRPEPCRSDPVLKLLTRGPFSRASDPARLKGRSAECG